jgi:homoserine O-acetyltransferase
VYRTYGALNPERTNGFVVCHALTGNAALDSWWGDMLGPGRFFDTDKYFVICLNVLGSCYGTTGPTSLDPASGKPYGSSFPAVSVRDSVRLHLETVRQGLGVHHVACVAGGSLGGMQSLEWACCSPLGFVGCVVAMCCGIRHTAWQIGTSECQRQAIYADPNWQEGDYLARGGPAPKAGLSVARQMAMVTYRSAAAYSDKFGRTASANGVYEVESYLRYQGERFTSRFDPLSYVCLTKLMDTHDLSRDRTSNFLVQPVCIISVNSDALYPPADQEDLHTLLQTNSEYHVLDSTAGHDGFLLEQTRVEQIGKAFLAKCLGERIAPPSKAELAKAAQSRPWGGVVLAKL